MFGFYSSRFTLSWFSIFFLRCSWSCGQSLPSLAQDLIFLGVLGCYQASIQGLFCADRPLLIRLVLSSVSSYLIFGVLLSRSIFDSLGVLACC